MTFVYYYYYYYYQHFCAILLLHHHFHQLLCKRPSLSDGMMHALVLPPLELSYDSNDDNDDDDNNNDNDDDNINDDDKITYLHFLYFDLFWFCFFFLF